MNLDKLREPFPSSDIEWRVGRAGKNQKGVWAMCLAYVTNRAIMERLDEVCGPGNWRNEYKEAPAGGVLCGLSVRVGDEWVTKWDGADNTEMEAVKGGLSGAMKRAGVQWGIGRYLYHLDEGWATINSNGAHFGKTKDGESFRWDPPGLPEWALPGGSGKPDGPASVNRQTGEVDEPASPSRPAQDRSEPKGDMIPCPACQGDMWDNREDEKSSINGGKRPDIKCKDKACDHAIWLKSWRDDLIKDLADLHTSGAIDAEQRDAAEKMVGSLSPAAMAKVAARVQEAVRDGIMS